MFKCHCCFRSLVISESSGTCLAALSPSARATDYRGYQAPTCGLCEQLTRFDPGLQPMIWPVVIRPLPPAAFRTATAPPDCLLLCGRKLRIRTVTVSSGSLFKGDCRTSGSTFQVVFVCRWPVLISGIRLGSTNPYRISLRIHLHRGVIEESSRIRTCIAFLSGSRFPTCVPTFQRVRCRSHSDKDDFRIGGLAADVRRIALWRWL